MRRRVDENLLFRREKSHPGMSSDGFQKVVVITKAEKLYRGDARAITDRETDFLERESAAPIRMKADAQVVRIDGDLRMGDAVSIRDLVLASKQFGEQFARVALGRSGGFTGLHFESYTDEAFIEIDVDV